MSGLLTLTVLICWTSAVASSRLGPFGWWTRPGPGGYQWKTVLGDNFPSGQLVRTGRSDFTGRLTNGQFLLSGRDLSDGDISSSESDEGNDSDEDDNDPRLSLILPKRSDGHQSMASRPQTRDRRYNLRRVSLKARARLLTDKQPLRFG